VILANLIRGKHWIYEWNGSGDQRGSCAVTPLTYDIVDDVVLMIRAGAMNLEIERETAVLIIASQMVQPNILIGPRRRVKQPYRRVIRMESVPQLDRHLLRKPGKTIAKKRGELAEPLLPVREPVDNSLGQASGGDLDLALCVLDAYQGGRVREDVKPECQDAVVRSTAVDDHGRFERLLKLVDGPPDPFRAGEVERRRARSRACDDPGGSHVSRV
jgi:hypothetical protein